jgi:F420H(2)-dependent biliverdin reductase
MLSPAAAVVTAEQARTPKFSRTKSARSTNVRFFFFFTMISPNEKDIVRLEKVPNLWLATVRSNQTPHLVPIWFVWDEGRAYICTARSSIKVRNILANSRVVFALEDADDPIVIEGNAKILEEVPDAVAERFLQKYEWNIEGDTTYNTVIEIEPRRVVL